MADTQFQISSSVAPSDSVSKAGRKSKPGKAERAARRSAVGSQPGQNASVAKVNFAKNLTVAALLRLAQQLVHSHVNMGLPQGDFAPVASTEVLIPSAVSAIVSQFGEFSVPALGTRFLLHDYTDTVKAISCCPKGSYG
ncbi:hypothetical protein BFPV1_s3gp1 [Botryotinia fuckeliana partitivirus 1]|uniref:hypothetical protein n=1 Tax=Botryotinia fuckeliana partitivirus 1 TaxID=425010 RepID=UPI0000F5850B|nr:hypothetical protein BFPV1_s3gp1 [Botryotinia fuckeliana partitivirus 1]CAM33268.1 hypothetical protein [Botryotinia fuckeliana partitivirus 1]